MASHASNSCTICNGPTALYCVGCNSAHYCSKRCQKTDWPTHKLLCAVFANFDTSSRPTDEHFKAILFPVDQEKPTIVWLHCKWWGSDSDGVWDQGPSELTSFLGSGFDLRTTDIEDIPSLKRKMTKTITVCYRDAFVVDGSRLNTSIESILATKVRQYYPWRGPFLIYGSIELDANRKACKDLDMKDFRHIADFFLSYGSKPVSVNPQPTKTKITLDVPKVKGVRINCVGDQTTFKRPQFEEVEVLSTDSIFTEHDTSDIAERVGLHIFTQRCYPNTQQANENETKIISDEGLLDNDAAKFLHLCCNPEAGFDVHTGKPGWGSVSQQWQQNPGSIIVVSKDKTPLKPWLVEALCKYCQFEIYPLFCHSLGGYGEEKSLSKDAVLTMICRPTFTIKLQKLVK